MAIPRTARRSWLGRVRPERLMIYIGAIVVIVVVVFPLLWSVSSSLKSFREIYRSPRALIPKEPTLENYRFLLYRLPNFPRQLVNSFVVTIGSVLLTVVLATTSGYGFARIRFRGRDLLFYSVIVSMFIPRSGGLMAQFELMAFLNLRNSLVGLILAFAAGLPVSMFIMRQAFLSIPHELEESAAIDGATTIQTFYSIALPMAASSLVVVSILKFVQVWGDYLFTLTMIDDQTKYTAAIGVAIVKSFVQPDATSSAHGTAVSIAPQGVMGAANVVVMLPVVILYILLQRWFVRGLTEGILKF